MKTPEGEHKSELFRAYLDESEDSGTGFYVVGGFVGTRTVWQGFEPEWFECYPTGITTFHATDCFTGNKNFQLLDLPDRVALLNKLTDVIVKHDVKLIGYGIDANAYMQHAPKPIQNDFLGNKYAAPFGGVAGLACEAMGNVPGPSDWDVLENGDNWEQCSFFIEKNQYSASAERTLFELRRLPGLWFKNRIGNAVYGTKDGPESISLLQVADLGAFLAAKHISKATERRIPWKPFYEKLKAAGRIHRTVIADKRSLEVLKQTHQELKDKAAGGAML